MPYKWMVAFLAITMMVFASVPGPRAGYASQAVAATDYADSGNWLSRPDSADKAVDIFYVYPTAWQRSADSDPTIADIDNAMMRDGAQLAYKRQATAFETTGNVYAPFYRQADAGYVFSLPTQDARNATIGGIPTSDVVAAFEYYLEHHSQGRPFILAGHSQGSNVIVNLLAGYLKEHPDVYGRMIAAYVIGYSVTQEYLGQNPHLKFAERSDDTGVIVSYNTEAPDVTGANPVLLPGALAINPITWRRAETVAPADQNLGSLILNTRGEVVSSGVKNYADARVDATRGVLVCSICDVDTLAPGHGDFPRGVYHSFDYPFYFENIRDNASVRTKAFLVGR